ncbi:hypothetical protein NRP93_001526 [Clostridium botulinum]|nr:hypothetical protein [Clostridium botulinum]
MKGKSSLGIIFLIIGLGIGLEALNLWDFGNIISNYWPIILIVVGVKKLLEKSVSYVNGIVLVLLGVMFQLRNLNILYNLSKFFWAGIFVLIGFYLLTYKESFKHKDKNFFSGENGQDFIKTGVLFSGTRTKNYSKAFKGGSITALFGGIDIDLLDAELSSDGAYIDVFVAFGGVDIIVPENWNVVMTGIPILGGWSNKTRSRNGNNGGPILKINCISAFGGVEVKNYFN